MDLMSEPSNLRVLAAKHVSGKYVPEEYTVNATVLCNSYDVQPDFLTYRTGLNPCVWVIWACGATLVVAICVIYVMTLRTALQIWRDCRVSVSVVLSVYPVVAALSLIVTILPRSRLLCEAISQQIVMVAMYQFFKVVISECGGFNQLITRSSGTLLETRVLPCCCWPCCVLPRPKVHKKSLNWLRYLVLQVPIIQGLLFFIMLLLRSESMALYSKNVVYLLPFVVVSILSGVWGVVMSVKAAGAVGLNLRPRFIVFQLVVIIVKLQSGIVKSLPDMITMPCVMALHPSVFVNLIHSIVMIVEMLLLSLFAWRLYSQPRSKNVEKMPQIVVAVLEDSASSKEKENKQIVAKKDEA